MFAILSNIKVFSSSIPDYVGYFIYALFAVAIISNFKKGMNLKKILFKGLYVLIAFATFFAIDVIIKLIGKPIDSETHKNVDAVIMYLSFLLCPLLTSALMCVLVKDYKLTVKIIKSSLLVTSWMFSPSIGFLLNDLIPGMGIAGVVVIRLLVVGSLFTGLFFFDIGKFHRIDVWSVLLFESYILVQIILDNIAQHNFDVKNLNIACLIIWGFQFFVYAYFYLFVKNYNEREEKDIENQKLQIENKFMDITKDNYEQMQMLKHDIKKQYSYIAMLYEQGKDEEAKKFFSEVSLAANETLNFATTGNTVLDVTINMVINKTKKDKIEFEYICACPVETRFLDSDFFSLLVNIFDNAIEGTLRNKTTPRKIVARINPRDNFLFIDVVNSIDSNYRGNVLTSKRNKKGHGYGKRIIKKIVKKYDGDVIFSHDLEHYEVKAMMALQSDDDLKAGTNNEAR